MDSIQAGVGFSTLEDTQAAARKAARDAMSQAQIEKAGWVLCFFTVEHFKAADAMLEALRQETQSFAIAGCSSLGVVVSGKEVESGPALAVMVGYAPRTRTLSTLTTRPEEALMAMSQSLGGGFSQNGDNSFLLSLTDSFQLDHTRIRSLGEKTMGGIPLFGSAATDDGRIGLSLQMGMEGVQSQSVSLLGFSGGFSLFSGITNGFEIVGEPHFMSKSEKFSIKELDGKPAFQTLKKNLNSLGYKDVKDISTRVMMGFPLNEENLDFSGKNTVLRQILGPDEENKGILVPHNLKSEGVVGIMQENPEKSRRELRNMLKEAKRSLGGPPRFGIYLNCAARGSRLYGELSVDAKTITEELGDFPLIGMFGGYELASPFGVPVIYSNTGVLILVGEKPASPPS